MKQVLLNIALFTLTDWCKAHDINISGTHPVKAGRGYRYNLVSSTTGEVVASVAFSKSSRPSFYGYKQAA